MEDANKQALAKRYIDVIRSGDRALLEATMTEDIVWSLPGASKMSGEARGYDEIIKRIQTFASFGVDIDFEFVLYGLDNVAVQLHNTGSRDGKTLDEHLVTVCTIRDEKICHLQTFLSDVQMLNGFFV